MSKVTQKICGKSQVCLPPELSSPQAKLKWHLNDHLEEAMLGSPRGPETVLKAPLVAGHPRNLTTGGLWEKAAP